MITSPIFYVFFVLYCPLQIIRPIMKLLHLGKPKLNLFFFSAFLATYYYLLYCAYQAGLQTIDNTPRTDIQDHSAFFNDTHLHLNLFDAIPNFTDFGRIKSGAEDVSLVMEKSTDDIVFTAFSEKMNPLLHFLSSIFDPFTLGVYYEGRPNHNKILVHKLKNTGPAHGHFFVQNKELPFFAAMLLNAAQDNFFSMTNKKAEKQLRILLKRIARTVRHGEKTCPALPDVKHNKEDGSNPILTQWIVTEREAKDNYRNVMNQRVNVYFYGSLTSALAPLLLLLHHLKKCYDQFYANSNASTYKRTTMHPR